MYAFGLGWSGVVWGGLSWSYVVATHRRATLADNSIADFLFNHKAYLGGAEGI